MLTEKAAETIAKSMVIPTMDYGNMFLTGCNADDLGDLEIIQNHAIRCAFNIFNPRDLHVNLLLLRANTMTLKKKRVVQLLCSIKRNIKNGLFKVQTPARYTRIHQGPIIKLPKPENESFKKCPFYYGCNIWNNLPVDCRNEESMDSFKVQVKNMIKANVIQCTPDIVATFIVAIRI